MLGEEMNGYEHLDVVHDGLLVRVYRDSGYDFRDYRRGTVTRRLERRVLASCAETYLEYTGFQNSNTRNATAIEMAIAPAGCGI